jgi:competence protein ComEA
MPSKRLLVYVVLGVVVLVVGIWGVVSLRAGGTGVEVSLSEAHASGGSGGEPLASTRSTVSSGSLGQYSTTSSTPGATSSSTTTTVRIWVQVAGAVRRPGVYQMEPTARVFQALVVAGGVTEDADEEALPLAARLWDGCRLVIPVKGQPHGAVLTGEGAPATGAGQSTGPSPGGGSQAPAGKISLSTASLEELDSLPGVGLSTAQQIVAYREANGPFTSVDQLTEVPGIGPAKLEKLRPLVEP